MFLEDFPGSVNWFYTEYCSYVLSRSQLKAEFFDFLKNSIGVKGIGLKGIGVKGIGVKGIGVKGIGVMV